MKKNSSLQWLVWAREIQALSQTGMAYTRDPFDRQRYQRLAEIAVDIIARHADLDPPELLQNILGQKGYATPKIDVRGAIIKDDRILLVQDFGDGRWCLPGGWADVGESPSAMVVREVREECGLEVIPGKIVGVYDNNRQGMRLDLFHAYKLIFICDVVAGTLTPSYETPAVEYFPLDRLPALSLTRTHERHIADVWAHYKNSALPTVFD